MCRAIPLIACSLFLFATGVDRTLAQQCPPNSHRTATSQKGNVRTIHCECNEGYVKNQGECKVPSALFSLQRVTGRGVYYLQLSNGRRLVGEQAQFVPIDGTVVAGTGPDSYMVLTLPDDTTFTLGANSRVELDKFVYDPNPSLSKVTARVIVGVFRYVTGIVSPRTPEKTIDLPVAAIGIRGTEFEGFVSPDGSGHLKLYAGRLSVRPLNGQPEFLLEAGQMISFTADKTMRGPMAF
jgi:hypothetical protein